MFFDKKGYIVCGHEPGSSGTGDLFKYLIGLGKEYGWGALHPKPLFKSRKLGRWLLSLKLMFLEDKKIIFLHPQTIGFPTLFFLQRRKNDIRYYVLDNSFFCIRSYNYLPAESRECFYCMRKPRNCHSSCRPEPIRISKKLNFLYIDKLEKISGKLTFYSQNQKQKELLENRFGKRRIKVEVIGMRTQEFYFSDTVCEKPGKIYDIVYHGTDHPAKGVFFVIALASILSQFSFLIPIERGKLDCLSNHIAIPENITFSNMRWNSGLKEQVACCRAVICPSLWSAPIESSLIKSLYYGRNVIVFDTQFGFHKEIPNDFIVRLSGDFKESARIVERLLSKNKSNDRKKVRKYLEKKIESFSIEKLFQ